ncbi:MAG: FTR1 family protein [Nitrososphaeraceae archaeon]|nr:FTR1 family protein [Nitrososphaeraceae archaeon]MDW0147609.1 FTR1 family protein [Nitrososphaeraceae archaeon]MDW0154176.1 FTR1 family protein [Nitrososphaeraceae archaeon]MDW0167100.1 FTR1 family protein [Nitrososphaeraceae archaeon]
MKIFNGKVKRKKIPLSMWIALLIPSLFLSSAYGTQNIEPSSNDLILMTVNLQRISEQINLVQASLTKGDNTRAFEHAYISHSAIFPSIKDKLREIDQVSADRLESLLIDLPIMVRSTSQSSEIESKLGEITNILNNINSGILNPNNSDYYSVIASTIIVLLNDTSKYYQLSDYGNTKNSSNQVNYENAIGMVDISQKLYMNISNSFSDSKQLEFESFFADLRNSLSSKSDAESISKLITAIQTNLNEESNIQSDDSLRIYFGNIKDLITKIDGALKNNSDYSSAEKYATTAYLDNFEYIEAPLEKVDPTLMLNLEIMMREELRELLKNEQQSQAIVLLANITNNLSRAASLLNVNYENLSLNDTSEYSSPMAGNTQLNNLSDITDLSKGFGTYSGEKRGFGESTEPERMGVRTDIDDIRIKLVDLLQQYKGGEYDEAFLTARSAYLDSYEGIEIPIRPINPDFTLDMEIKFAELRNLIQQHQPYDKIEAKIVEIRNGLDESERLVTGTGSIAPSLAFTTSFSIIFREGLESALIIGAILAYLDASRNARYKKHVYLGIVIAIIATVITWYVAQFIIGISGASRELIEAIAGISAVAVLFWVSFWILNKVETKKWIEFVKAKVWQATTTGSVMVFAMLSFFTVYREGFETVLFYQAMFSFAKNMETFVLLGLVLGLAVIISVVFIIRKIGKKLPLRVLFGLTMAIGAYMSIAFIGNAIREFQEVGYISTTHLFGIIPRLEINLATMTGIHPTLETTVAQIILLSVYVIGSLYILIIQPRRKKLIESSRKSMANLKDGKKG